MLWAVTVGDRLSKRRPSGRLGSADGVRMCCFRDFPSNELSFSSFRREMAENEGCRGVSTDVVR